MRKRWRFESGDFDFETAERIRRRIQNIAKSKGITIKELSVKAGYSDSYLSRVLSGQRRLSSDHLTKLSHALEVPIPALKKSKKSKFVSELFYDERLTPLENWRMEGMLQEIKEGLVNYFLKKRPKKGEKEIE